MTLRIYCPSCSGEIKNDSGLCPTCGLTLHSLETDETRPYDSGKSPSARTSQKAISYDSIDDARFVPGTILDGRYRIVGLLGKGGMGEVYRADDLKLAQPVALKFLPEHLLSDGAALARFHREVRVARQVSHRNVCRVYDIGETEGRHFLSMEYIKGEELSSLLRRIGRLPVDKATQLARQICAGLSAAHDVGVLHRDLKPSNVMIDGDGNARILDFGLAGLTEEFGVDERAAGTPAYMAPEQMDGQPLTARSDIYSLGLLLYELFTSQRAFDAPTLGELIQLRRSNSTPPTPTSIVKDLDPAIERVIDRCLIRDPSQRPSSALQVAASLPGGDPIAAALAAGETPSPEMVAAAPKLGTLRPAIAASLLGSVIFFIGLAMVLSKYSASHRIIPFQKSPELLKEQASQIATSLGYTRAPADKASGFDIDFEYVHQLETGFVDPWEVLRYPEPPLIRFWYRQSPGVLVPLSQQAITFRDPPIVPGMLQMRLDTEGRLNYLEAAPDQGAVGPSSSAEPSSEVLRAVSSNPQVETELWANLFRAAALDLDNFKPTESLWTPPSAYDTRRAWTGAYPNLKTPIRVEAASFRDRPVYFTIVSPWNRPVSEAASADTLGQKFFVWILFAIFFGILLLGVFLAWRNLRLGRGDRRGAFRVTVFVFIARMLVWGFATHHVADNAEFLLLVTGIQSALFWSCFVGLMYLALEPYLRRRWPETIISWNRLLVGEFRDPLVGRDILIGSAIGAFITAMMEIRVVLPRFVTSVRGFPDVNDGYESGVTGVSAFGTLLINQITGSMVQTFMVVFLLLFLTLLLRRQWLAVAAGWLILAGLLISPEFGRSHWIGLACIGVVIGTVVFCAIRFGPVALMSTLIVMHLWVFYPITTEFRAWYASSFLLLLALLLALATWSFYISLGGQKLFKGRLLGDE